MLEEDDPFVLYTDFDVVFLRDVPLPPRPPRYIACAPEFRPDGWHYFNSGVMVMNVANMRRGFPEFLRSAKHRSVRVQQLLRRPLEPARSALQLEALLG